MDHRLIEGLMTAIDPVIREFSASAVEKATAPLIAAIAELRTKCVELEAREPVKGEVGEPGAAGEPGQSVTVADVRPLLEGMVAELPKPSDGKSIDPADVRLMVSEEVAKIPPASDGKSVTLDDVRPLLEGMVAELPKAIDGKSVDPADVRLMVAEEVAKIPPASDGKSVTVDDVRPLLEGMVAELPKPSDGKSITVEDVQPVIKDQVDKAVAALPKAKDGVGMAGALIDRSGVLVATLSDGTTRELGVVVGRDADREQIKTLLTEEIGGLPHPKPGPQGEPGPPGEIPLAPDDVAVQVARAIALVAESSPIADKGIVLNINSAAERPKGNKTITTRRDKDGNLVAEVVEAS